MDSMLRVEYAPSIGIIRTGTKGLSQPGRLAKYPRSSIEV